MSFAFVPLYIRFMGIEAYGLVGFFSSMLAIFFVLDMGLSTTLNRKLARLEGPAHDLEASRTLVRTLEMIYWVVGIVIVLAIILAAPVIALDWLNADTLPDDQVVRAIRLMGVIALFRWPVSLYSGALLGLRRQVSLNAVTSIGATVQSGGAVLMLWLVAPTITVFFLWQAFATLLQIAVLITLTWYHLRLAGHHPRFAGSALSSIARFSAGVTGISLFSVLLDQSDKVFLIRLVPLVDFVYYTLAITIALVLVTAGGAIYSAVFPVFSTLYAEGRIEELVKFYHKSCEVLSISLISAAVFIAVFPNQLLTAYLHDPMMVEHVQLLLRVQVVSTCLLGLSMGPLGLQLGSGLIKLELVYLGIAILIFIPLLLLFIWQFGSIGAALARVLLAASFILVLVSLMHRRLLPGEQWRFFVVDLGVPLILSIFMAALARLFVSDEMPILGTLVIIGVFGFLAVGFSAILLPGARLATWNVIRAAGRRLRTPNANSDVQRART